MNIPVGSIEFLLLAENHNRSDFSCGNEILDRYLQHQAGQDARRNLSATFVLTSQAQPDDILGYYSLSATVIDPGMLSPAIRKKLPPYSAIPATLIGRLARSLRHKGSGIGELLLMDALYRSYEHSKSIASFAVVVDAIDEGAHQWYAEKWQFIKVESRTDRLYLPMKTIEKLFKK